MIELLVLLRIAFRNLFASFLNVVIGIVILVGTFLFVVGGSLLGSVDSSMSRSITGSVAGNIQIYSDKSKDELALYDNWSSPDLAVIPDFSKVKSSLLSIENIKTVIPMGTNGASITYGNTVDVTLDKLRKAVNTKLNGDHSPELAAKIESLKSHVRQIVNVIEGDYKKLAVISSDQGIDRDGVAAIEKASSASFWSDFDHDPLAHLEFLENKVSSLVPDADMIYLSYVGTDLDAFSKSFDRMQVVDGQMVPTGQRGKLLSKYQYEDQFKLKIARRLDQIQEAITEQGKKIATDPDLQLMIKQNRNQTREIVLQLDPLTSSKAISEVQGFLKTNEEDLPKLLSLFFDTNDSNFSERYKFFYSNLAPLVELYRLKPGDTLTITTFTKSGFIQSTNVKVYGTFQFKGLEKSGLAGGMSLMDLMTFRDLYGYVTPEKLAETKELEKSVGAQFVDKDRAEADLFGGSSTVGNAKEQRIDDQKELGNLEQGKKNRELMSRPFTQDELDHGIILNSAIILKDPSKIDETMKEISAVSKKDNLDLRVVTWQKAAGMIGQFVYVAKAALYLAVFIIFVVALVIINNAIMMATLQRSREIGTMRAIGAQRGFVLSLVLIETLLLGLSFGVVGTFLGSMLVKWLGHVGIPAGNEFLYFFFSGPRLYVNLGLGSIIGAFIIIFLVTAVSALYPAIIATRVSPIQAMSSED
jgi:ABC-type lipoprotein release transport system permease subunit